MYVVFTGKYPPSTRKILTFLMSKELECTLMIVAQKGKYPWRTPYKMHTEMELLTMIFISSTIISFIFQMGIMVTAFS